MLKSINFEAYSRVKGVDTPIEIRVTVDENGVAYFKKHKTELFNILAEDLVNLGRFLEGINENNTITEDAHKEKVESLKPAKLPTKRSTGKKTEDEEVEVEEQVEDEETEEEEVESDE